MATSIVLWVIYLVLLFLGYELLLPPISIGFLSGVLFFGANFIIVSFLIANTISNIKRTQKLIPLAKYAMNIVGILVVFLLVAGTPLFNSEKMYNQIGEVKEHSFTDDNIPFDNVQIPVVDEQLARQQGEKILSEMSNLKSEVTLGTFNMQHVNGKLFFVAPLEHKGFLNWVKNKSTPGYITVSATDPTDVKFISTLDGNNIKLKYLFSSYFTKEVTRHVRTNGYSNCGLMEASFELDDSGKPYYIITKYENETFLFSPETTGVITCDVQTGELNEYTTENAPKWIDKIQPHFIVERQIDNYGKYEHGVFNFSNKDELVKTDDIMTIYDDGQCYYYTKLVSANPNETKVAFMMINARTKEAFKFSINKEAEEAVMRSTQEIIQDSRYQPTKPILVNIKGVPTYLIAFKDDDAVTKQYALVNMVNYSMYAIGNTMTEVEISYILELSKIQNIPK